jgi:uridine phosphorylase
VNEGTNITTDSFYSSQGRFDPSFNDENDRLISEVLKKYPKAITMDAWRSMGNNG